MGPVNASGNRFKTNRAIADGIQVSTISFVWTLLAGATAITLGLRNDSLVLVAFGGLSALDAAGSSALIVHFRHSFRHESVSARQEQVALSIITIGMAVLGLATIAESALRLAQHAVSRSDLAGIALSGLSLVVLATLALTKRRVSAAIPSHALHSDSWLSAIGAMLALVTLSSTALDAAYGWWWLDPVASLVIALGAVSLSIKLTRGGNAIEENSEL
jgi:divalent metal cation (Fe/Co/Zn/Cd) transporter